MNEINLNGLKMVFTKIETSEDVWYTQGQNGCDEKTFIQNNRGVDKSIFTALDFNEDGYVTETEFNYAQAMAGDDQILNNKEKEKFCMEEMKFFARRDVDKWFKVDKNRDGFGSNVEWESWRVYNSNGKTLEGPLSNEELSKKYGMPEVVNINDSVEEWINGSIDELKEHAKRQYGYELTEKNIIELKKEQIKQLNTWLMKTGDNKESSLYQQLNLDAGTRLGSTEDGHACCGGDICEFSGFELSNLRKNGKYTAEEMKARLNWASNSYLVNDDGNTLYDENGNTIPAKLMTPDQVEKYKKIVESVTGVEWDSDNWEVNIEQFFQIAAKSNGTDKDDELLQGKTRKDIPENRQALLRFLEEKGWLYEQFKE